MKPKQERLMYEELATLLVTPERFGKVAEASGQLVLPELARIYEFPVPAPQPPEAA